MNKIIYIILLYLFSNLIYAQKKTYVISSGSRGGNYYKTGNIIDSILNNEYPKFAFKNIWSDGSIDNLKNLEEKKVDFALTQHNILIQNFFKTSKGAKDIEIIMPLFKEELLIYCKDTSERTTIKKLAKDLTDKNTVIGITSKKSYSYKLFKDISQLLNLPINKVTFVEKDYSELIAAYKNDEINYLITFSTKLQEIENEINKSTIFFSKQETDFILSKSKNLIEIKHDQNNFSIGTFTYLIGLNSPVETLDLEKPLFHTLKNSLFSNNSNSTLEISNSLDDFLKQRDKLLHGFIPLNHYFKTEFLHKTESIKSILYVAITMLISFLIAYLIYLKKYIHKIDFKKYWHRYNHFFLGIIILVVLYIIAIELMIFGEKQLFNSVSVKSQILNMPRSKLHFWIVTSNLAQDNEGIFPISGLAKLMYSLAFYTIWLGGICLAIAEFIIKKIINKRNNGLMTFNYKNHTVITGWNNNTEMFIRNFFSVKKEFITSESKLVLIVENAQKIREENSYIHKLVNSRDLSLINGDIREEKTLVQANVFRAKTVVLFAEDNSTRSDEKTLLRALSISRHCRNCSLNEEETFKYTDTASSINVVVDKYIDSIYIIAEVNDLLYREDLYRADVNEVICSAIYTKNIITQSVFNHGVSKVLDEILNYNDLNEFYEINLKLAANKKLRHKTFDELILPLRSVNIQLVAIRKVYYDAKTNKRIIDRDEIQKLLALENLTRDIIINPQNDIENMIKTDEDDALIVLCSSEKALNIQLKKLTL